MIGHTILWEGEQCYKTVYRDRLHTKIIQHPMDGEEAYIIHNYEEHKVRYSAKYGIWHKPGADLKKQAQEFESAKAEQHIH